MPHIPKLWSRWKFSRKRRPLSPCCGASVEAGTTTCDGRHTANPVTNHKMSKRTERRNISCKLGSPVEWHGTTKKTKKTTNTSSWNEQLAAGVWLPQQLDKRPAKRTYYMYTRSIEKERESNRKSQMLLLRLDDSSEIEKSGPTWNGNVYFVFLFFFFHFFSSWLGNFVLKRNQWLVLTCVTLMPFDCTSHPVAMSICEMFNRIQMLSGRVHYEFLYRPVNTWCGGCASFVCFFFKAPNLNWPISARWKKGCETAASEDNV